MRGSWLWTLVALAASPLVNGLLPPLEDRSLRVCNGDQCPCYEADKNGNQVRQPDNTKAVSKWHNFVYRFIELPLSY